MNTEERLVYASRYIHRNPMKISDLSNYRWSSYRQYLGTVSGMADPGPVLELFESKDSYITFVESAPISEIARRNGKFFLGPAGAPGSVHVPQSSAKILR
jgi:hypothetical protein